MRAQSFHFEIKDLITLFCSAFDNIIIKRYDKNRVPANNVQVRYVYAPKQRVIYDLVNLAQNITLPVVSVSINSISRDESRVFNKIQGYYVSNSTSPTNPQPSTTHYLSPVPVNIDINMSILTKFQSDMDQILSNFIPFNNPYIILSWKVPEDLAPAGFTVPQEIRSEVLWSGAVNLSYPTDINASEKYKISGDTSFTIKGWLFPNQQDPVGNIFYITENFVNVDVVTSLQSLTSIDANTDTININGYPQITNPIEA